MMVTFISQCEKKSLAKTRRVLDAFADRIGANTWQTIITEEGLIAVKKLLRQTATKNTAVACHWMRSRSRSELVWVVGAKDKFNQEGVIPVNSTQKELFMDVRIDGKPIKGVFYANTHLQSLTEHLFAVGFVAEQLHRRLAAESNKQSVTVFVAGCMHDIGKLDPKFQEWVTNLKKQSFAADDGQHIDDAKFNFDKHPRHNEISAMLFQLLDNKTLKELNPSNKDSLEHIVFWHHAKPFRKEKDFENYGDIYSKLKNNLSQEQLDELFKKTIERLTAVCELDATYRDLTASKLAGCFATEIDTEDLSGLKKINLPQYKQYKDCEDSDRLEEYKSAVKINADNNLMRSCVISADRLVSALSATDLHAHIKNKTLDQLLDEVLLKESNLGAHIEQCLTSFPADERSHKQAEVAQQLTASPNVSVLAGAAGCGKTKIALEWAKLKNAQQIIWICPRVQVCQGLFSELITEQYLPNAQIEINTGEYKYTNKWSTQTKDEQLFQGDIVITTIDQVLNTIISHSKADALIDYMNVHVVFDEFHEYVNMPAFNLLFAELIACKRQRGKLANTLLVSATPHYYFIEEFLDIHRDDVVVMPSFNQSLYKLDFQLFDETIQDDSNPFYKKQNENTFVISNTAITAQKSFIRNQNDENSILLHSKFKKSDKQKWFDEVYESFKKDGTKKYKVLRSGPIVQASLNISCDYMVTELTHAENCLQRLGRLDRFGQNKAVNVLCVAVPDSIDKGRGVGASARFMASMNVFASTKAWLVFLRHHLPEQPVNLKTMYEIYKNFYASDENKTLIKSDLIGSLKKSVASIDDKVFAPLVIKPKQSAEKGRAKISKNSLRGDNRFVQMAVYNVNNPNAPQFIDKYAYQMPINDSDEVDNTTASRNQIEGYGDSNKNLLAHMMKKHHNIKGGVKAHKDFILLNEARDPEFPVYLSYTPSDLVEVGGESARHGEAIYYAVCDKQPIGAISIKQLTSD
jgi:CRISPR-associated endonuclease/helicase Cas3